MASGDPPSYDGYDEDTSAEEFSHSFELPENLSDDVHHQIHVMTKQAAVIYPQAAVTFALIVCVLFIVFGVVGNATTIVALLRNKKLRSASTSVFIVSLALTDLIFCAFNLPIIAARYAHQKWIFGSVLCQMFPFFFYLNVCASLFNMMFVTINRYVLVAHYRHYDRIFRPLVTATMIAFCWGFPLALEIPVLAGRWGIFGYDAHTFSCTILPHNGKSPKKFFFLLGFILPCTIIVLCYARIIYIVHASRRNLMSHNVGARATEKRQADEMSLTKVVAVIFVAFIVCYLPLTIVNVADDEETVPALHVIASVLAWMASVLNPIIYAAMNRRYRKAYIALLLPCLQFKRSLRASCTAAVGSTANGANCSLSSPSYPSVSSGNSLLETTATYKQMTDDLMTIKETELVA